MKYKKLTEDQVISIFSDSRTQRSIAQEYGVNQALIQRIKKGKVWKHITNPEYAKMLKIGASSEGMI